MIDPQYAPGSFGCHELLHTTLILSDTVGDRIIDHPAIKNSKEWLALAWQANDALSALYQAIAAEHMK